MVIRGQLWLRRFVTLNFKVIIFPFFLCRAYHTGALKSVTSNKWNEKLISFIYQYFYFLINSLRLIIWKIFYGKQVTHGGPVKILFGLAPTKNCGCSTPIVCSYIYVLVKFAQRARKSIFVQSNIKNEILRSICVIRRKQVTMTPLEKNIFPSKFLIMVLKWIF